QLARLTPLRSTGTLIVVGSWAGDVGFVSLIEAMGGAGGTGSSSSSNGNMRSSSAGSGAAWRDAGLESGLEAGVGWALGVDMAMAHGFPATVGRIAARPVHPHPCSPERPALRTVFLARWGQRIPRG